MQTTVDVCVVPLSLSGRSDSGINSLSVITASPPRTPRPSLHTSKTSPARLQKSILFHLTAPSLRAEPRRCGIKKGGQKINRARLFTNWQLEVGARGNLAEAPREHEIPIPESHSVNASRTNPPPPPRAELWEK